MFNYDKSNQYYYSTTINDGHFLSGFSTRKTVMDHVFDNKFQICKIKQIHSDNIVDIDKSNYKLRGDGIITSKKNIVLAINTADCVPIIYVDKKKRIIAVSHQGWQGTLKRFPRKMILHFLKLKSKISDLRVAIGPAIGECCYDVYRDRYMLFKNEFKDHEFTPPVKNKYYINLTLLNYLTLRGSGLAKNQIDFFPFCTSCHEKQFVSYRRDGAPLKYQMTNFVSQL
ncbi:hypothetical protein A3J15_03355 [Candidatus Roizmanbacteria bacterium RIFCSPLOWO2_02_FULL_38_10]|uniref:Purine nucleoside phosphorylase n=1 Tax=Candidatus Roizmanbacteria bacterium RIFCSPLOWO2_02_FULL_38_10 TaxID=1802074 RepID=A0A1F7JMY2_9BACT|nr:MAG: hypothetical protein A3J15_03355 [Candidatus Roizmanbacteria bacterium RIFCSPLOWO2_02_FULL_38_10]